MASRPSLEDIFGAPQRPSLASIFGAPPEEDDEESRFQSWYAKRARAWGLDPNPDDPLHLYDYRAAFRAGAEPDPASGHWPSEFKADAHPNRYVGILDTKTGQPARPAWAANAPTAEEALEDMPSLAGAYFQEGLSDAAAGAKALGRGVMGARGAIGGAVESLGAGAPGVIGDVLSDVGQSLRQTSEIPPSDLLAAGPQEQGDIFSQAAEDPGRALLVAGGENAPNLAVSALATYFLGPAGGLAMSGALEGGAAYEQALAEGADEEEAGRAALATAILNAPLDYLPVGKALARLKGGSVYGAKKAVAAVGVQAALEFGTEGVQEINNQLVAVATHAGEQGFTWKDIKDSFDVENLRRYGAAGAVGALLGSMTGTTVSAAATVVEDAVTEPTPPPTPVEDTGVPTAVTLEPEVREWIDEGEGAAEVVEGKVQEPQAEGPTSSEVPAEPWRVYRAAPYLGPPLELSRPAGPEPRAKGAMQEAPLPLPQLRHGVKPEQVAEAWNYLSRRHPRLAAKISVIEEQPRDGIRSAARIDYGGGTLYVAPGEVLSPSTLAHELTHVAQQAPKEETREERAKREAFAYKNQEGYEDVSAPGGVLHYGDRDADELKALLAQVENTEATTAQERLRRDYAIARIEDELAVPWRQSELSNDEVRNLRDRFAARLADPRAPGRRDTEILRWVGVERPKSKPPLDDDEGGGSPPPVSGGPAQAPPAPQPPPSPSGALPPGIAELAERSLAIGDESGKATGAAPIARVVRQGDAFVALDDGGRELGELLVQEAPEGGFRVRHVKTGGRGTGVARALYRQAATEMGPYRGSTSARTPAGEGMVARLRQTDPDLFTVGSSQPSSVYRYQELLRSEGLRPTEIEDVLRRLPPAPEGMSFEEHVNRLAEGGGLVHADGSPLSAGPVPFVAQTQAVPLLPSPSEPPSVGSETPGAAPSTSVPSGRAPSTAPGTFSEAEIATKPEEIAPLLGGAGKAIAEGLYVSVWDRLRQGKPPSPFAKQPPAEQAAWDAYRRGEVNSAEDVRRVMLAVGPAGLGRLPAREGLPETLEVRREDIDVEPGRFQYKEVVNERGETGRLFASRKWDPAAGEPLRVWQDPADGRLKLVDGHQRVGLYDRSGSTAPLRVQAIQAPNAESARTVGALLNLKGGSGTAFDAAKLFRAQPNLTPQTLEEEGLALTEGIVRRGMALKNLDPWLFREAATGRMREGHGVILGEELADNPEHQTAVYKRMAEREAAGKPLQDNEVRTLARLAKAAGSTDVETAQQGLFGDMGSKAESLMDETLAVYRALEREFLGARRDLAALGRERVAARAEAEEIGKIDAKRGAVAAKGAAADADLFERLGYSRPFSGYVAEAAGRIARGEPAATVVAETRERFRSEFARLLAPTQPGRSEASGSGGEAPQPGLFGSAGGNLVRQIFGNQRGPLKPPTPAAVKSANDEVERRWRAARGIRSPGVLARTREGVRRLAVSFRRAYPDLDPKASPEFARAADLLRLHGATDAYSKMVAFDAVDEITKGLTPEQGDLLTRLTVLPDIARDVERGLYAGKELPFGYKSAAEVEADLGRFEKEADKPENKPVRQAQATRERIRTDIVDRLVEAGFLPEAVKEDARYYHRQVMAYADRVNVGRGASTVRTARKGFQRERAGGGDFNTDLQQAEFEWLSDAVQLLEKKATLDAVKANSDTSEQLKTEAKVQFGSRDRWKELLPDNYVLWQPQKGNHFYLTHTVPERALAKILAGEKEFQESDLREALALGGKKEEWAIPQELATTLDRMASHSLDVPEAMWIGAQSTWKQWTLLNPTRAIRYNLNNMSGDLDIAVAIDPRILRTAPRNGRDLWSYHLGRNASPAVRERVQKLTKLGVFDSGLTIEEIPDINREGMLRALSETRPGPLSRTVQGYWRGIKGFTVWRENILRGAAYDHFRSEIARGRNPYGASNPKEIDAIKDPEKRAAKLAREAIGDYGNISHAGKWIRRRLIPFYSWLEINAPRYVRLLRNAALHEGKSAAAGKAGRIAATAGARGVVSLALRANLLYGLMWLWNHAPWNRELEEELGEARREPHIILGRDDETGEVRSLRFQGALSDALDWFALADWPADIAKVKKGEETVKAKVAEAVKGPAEKIAVGWEPVAKTLFETALGRTVYPQLFRSGESFDFGARPVIDRGGHVARAFSLGWLWDRAMNRPRRGAQFDRFVIYRTDPGEAAYYHTMQLQSDWLREQGKGSGAPTDKNDRQLAAYFYKKAARIGDEKRAEHWYDEYFKHGGTKSGLKTSIAKSAPMGLIAKKDRRKFKESLSPDERKAVELAERWYKGSVGAR